MTYGQSLPSRERGLKSNMFDNGMPGKESLPSRERGLKYVRKLQTLLV